MVVLSLFLSPELVQFENTQIAEIHCMVRTFLKIWNCFLSHIYKFKPIKEKHISKML